MRYFFITLLCAWSFVSTAASLDVYDLIGGDFELNSTLGKKIGPQSFRGKVLLIFFGYTSCPDICPITLTTVKDSLENLEPSEVEQVQPLFISVDP
ncbi:MAG: SCO family protein, partial [SAR324 cluster bacterium]|nr:SCO family protein [SAR324 cluster bacterium]